MTSAEKESTMLEKIVSAAAELTTEQKRDILALAAGINVGRKINQEQNA